MFSFCRASCWLEKRGENILTKKIIPLEWDVASIMAMPNFLRTLNFYSVIAWGSDLFMTVSHVCVSLFVKACLMKDIACFRHRYKLPATNSNYSTLLSLKVYQVSYVPPYVTQCFVLSRYIILFPVLPDRRCHVLSRHSRHAISIHVLSPGSHHITALSCFSNSNYFLLFGRFSWSPVCY